MTSPDLLHAKRVRFVSLDHTRLPADGNLHRVVLGVNEKTGLFEGLHDGYPGVESFHALQGCKNLSVR